MYQAHFDTRIHLPHEGKSTFEWIKSHTEMMIQCSWSVAAVAVQIDQMPGQPVHDKGLRATNYKDQI